MARVAVITGAAGGIGAATCAHFESAGWEVVPVDQSTIDHPRAIKLNLADAEQVLAQLGMLPRVDALVNNAACQHFKRIEDTSVAEWDDVFAVNSRAPFACIKATLASLIEHRGSIVNVASVHALATSSSIAAYAATKGGLLAFTRALAVELGPRGVRCNAVLPGAVDTPALHDGLDRSGDPAAALRALRAKTPLGRIGTPAEIAAGILFAADQAASGFMTGQTLTLDGGALARLSTE